MPVSKIERKNVNKDFFENGFFFWHKYFTGTKCTVEAEAYPIIGVCVFNGYLIDSIVF